jgi:hypothetical protein
MSDYHKGIETISSTGLKMLLQQSPAHFHRAYTEERPAQTKAQTFGIAAHVYILEGQEVFDQRYAIEPDVNKRTKAGKAEYAEWLLANEGKDPISEDDAQRIAAMAVSFNAHPEVRAMMFGTKGQAEHEISWRDPITGANCKCKPDWLAADTSLAIDLKTCDSAHPTDVSRAIRRYMYHLSAAFYLQGIEAERLKIPQWRWVFVEKKAPYAVAVYHPAAALIDDGDALVSRALDIYRTCSRRNAWRAYDDESMEIDIYRHGKE